mmetsp:Transcript_9968/g.12434  ORF Transcript_9968/g.12434 Transcript_9968/m.12434 type:complete len:148 (+) Transcript_9968:255-698(+)
MKFQECALAQNEEDLFFMPPDMLLRILSYLKGNEVALLQRICKKWKSSVETLPEIWKNLVLAHPKGCLFREPESERHDDSSSWKRSYVQLHCYENLLCSHCFRSVGARMEPEEKKRKLKNIKPLCTFFYQKNERPRLSVPRSLTFTE